MNRVLDRRHVLWLVAGVPLACAGVSPAFAARTAEIERLMREARSLPHVSERINYISGKLLGVRYVSNTLIGSPQVPEQFVVRDDAFDCVTFCEAVLAAALSNDLQGFETTLRRIRYDHGRLQYDQRNHYFADWCQRNIDNGICRPVAIEPSVAIEKTVFLQRELPPRKVTITAIDKATMFAEAKRLSPGDIIGFASRREGLDYYHTGFIAFGRGGELMLRSASLSRGRVLDEPMTGFVSANPVKYVTLLRAVDNAPLADRR